MAELPVPGVVEPSRYANCFGGNETAGSSRLGNCTTRRTIFVAGLLILRKLSAMQTPDASTGLPDKSSILTVKRINSAICRAL